MPADIRITISSEAHAAIRANSIGEFHDTSVRNPNGTYTVPISNDVLLRLETLSSYWGLSFSDTIIRGLTQQKPQ